ncbi:MULTISPECIES: cyclic nucleotide-binding domain-containing protein [unclassified Rhizobium]|uniref:cyclic nucleotide-binding domain-containing protein n=1 Tax=unclassified Rhizobium TaxID=2613769 RepID=UPI0007124C21|nr:MULTISPECIES: cyclic nucleotide-binding domain-containing protein [unclassified Rhizobium]KQS83917.1 protein kinase [Rhizobium sp. Leaf386]KQS95743.1 protein kinase [Rhizobium sp. Leaf391]KQU08857.1 protein kinase [Rhizobium sp. Leaf453]
MALNDDIALLSLVPLFAGIDEDKLRLIAFGAERRRLNRGQQLFREGAPADCAYAVASGSFTLTRSLVDGSTETIDTVGRGTLLSELAMISFVERKFTATAEEDSEVIRINRPLFRRMLEEYPEVAVIVETRIRDNLQTMISKMQKLARKFR